MTQTSAEPTSPGEEAAVLAPPLTDWALVPFEATRLSPVWIGLAFLIGFTALCQIFRVATEDVGSDFWNHRYFWVDVLNGALFAYPPTATALLRRSRLRDLRDLRPVLECSEAEFARAVRELVCVPHRRLAAGGVLMALALVSMPVFDPAYWEGPRPALTDPAMLFHLLRNVATGGLVGHAVMTEATAAVGFDRIGARGLRVDLLDLRPLAPFARAGQRSAFAWVLAASMVSLFWFGPAVGNANGAIICTILLLVSAAFFFSVRGAHESIRATKERALTSLNAQIRRGGDALMQGHELQDAPRVADLVALRTLLEHVHEWPIGIPTIVRGGLIAALAIGSWLGGALVERMLESVVG
jgi:hypothetical protein